MGILGNSDRGLLFVLSAPAGTGKTTLAQKLVEEFPTHVVRSITTTTREPRKNEHEGKDYYFVSEEEFFRMKREERFLESATVFGKHYGTSKDEVERMRKAGKHVLLVIDTQGADSVRKLLDPITIFVKPPSEEELKHRLVKRNMDSEADMETRLSWATKELTQASKFDYIIVNDDLDVAYQVLRSIIIAEEHKVRL